MESKSNKSFVVFLASNKMEPMALGSPTSPSSGTGVYPNQQQSGAQYLPGYLMGDITSQVRHFSNFVSYPML